ncbi:MAG: GTPase Era [Rickettsiaceae bacterium]|jgi:GTP-binding protein Era|nr:GTPase Era [Rickettsiaceae bacterium]
MNKKNGSKKFGQICIIGKPNAGKSTLLNTLIGQKISIVTPKVQTTRSSITGILTIEDTQLVFIDTPGIFAPKKKLEKAMVRAAWSSIIGSDFVAVIVDSTRAIDEDIKKIFSYLSEHNIQPIILLNKKDLAKDEQIKVVKEEINSIIKPQKIFEISALQGTNCNELTEYLIANCTESEWLYSEDEVTSAPMRFLASEITREQLFLNLSQELPYNLTVETEKWQDLDNGEAIIHQVIYVARDSHKMIVLGHKGRMIKKISETARKEIESALDITAHLYLYVKVRSNWEDNPFMYDYMGLKMTE